MAMYCPRRFLHVLMVIVLISLAAIFYNQLVTIIYPYEPVAGQGASQNVVRSGIKSGYSSNISPSTVPAIMQRYAKNNTIFLSSLDVKYVPIAQNLHLTSYARFNLTNHLFVASDNQTCVIMRAIGANCVQYLSVKNSKDPTLFDASDYNRKTYIKPQLVLMGLQAGLTVVLVDLDVVFYQNPLPYLYRPDCDIVYQPEAGPHDMNSGFFMIKPTEAGLSLVERALSKMSTKRPGSGDQIYFNQVLRNMRRLRKIRAVSLDPNLFLNGYRFYERDHIMFKDNTAGNKCVVLHNNYVVSIQAKRYRFRELGQWLLDNDGYYTNKTRKYITFNNPIYFEDKLSIAKFGACSTAEMERQSLLTAFVIGYVLNRTVILPKFHCVNKRRYFKPSPGELCYLAALYGVRTLEAYTTNYREHIFLQHQLVPTSVKNSMSVVHLIGVGTWNNITKPSNVTILSPNASPVSMDDIQRWFISEQSSVLRFHSLYTEIGGLDEKTHTFITGLSKALKTSDFRQFKG